MEELERKLDEALDRVGSLEIDFAKLKNEYNKLAQFIEENQ